MTLLLIVYFQYFYQTFNISRMMFTEVSFQHKAYTELFAVSVCFDLTERQFFRHFCKQKLKSFECDKFRTNLEVEIDRYEIERTFDQSIKIKEDQDLSRVYYNWSQMFCIKFFKRENFASIKNKFYYSIKMCEISEPDVGLKQFLQKLLFRIYIHPMDTKPDLKKDYVYKFNYKQEAKYAQLDIYFEKTESLLLPAPYWTECKDALNIIHWIVSNWQMN